MAIKPNAKICIIKEQIIQDEVTGLSFQFQKMSEDKIEKGYQLGCCLTIISAKLPFGNRDIIFGNNGEYDGCGTSLTKSGCRFS